MYHGSKTFIEDYLEPRISFDLKPFVYGTDDYFYALVRSGNFDISKFLVREEYTGKEDRYQLAEIVPGAFKYLFDRVGYIYVLNDNDFTLNPDGYNEFLAQKKVKIQNTIRIDNIWKEITENADHYELIFYENSESYWKTVRGGKEGYLKRKSDALSRVLNAQN